MVELLVLLILAAVLYGVSKLSKIKREDVPLENIEVNDGISEESQEIMKN